MVRRRDRNLCWWTLQQRKTERCSSVCSQVVLLSGSGDTASLLAVLLPQRCAYMFKIVLTIEPLDMANSTILLPIEEKNRELYARVLISLSVIERGYDVVIGQQWEIFDRLNALPPSVLLFKGNNAAQAKHMVRAKKAGHLVCSIEEEVFGLCDERLILACYDSRTVDLVDLFFVQSDFQRGALLKRWPRLSSRIKVVGNPRNDVMLELRRRPPSIAAERLKRAHGPFVLFNTNFASINPVIDDIYGCFELCVRVGLIKPNDDEDIRLYHQNILWERENFDAMVSLALALANAGVTVAIRPHPSENADIWVRQLGGIENVILANSESQIDWLRASELMVHSASTTGLEAFLLGIPAISLVPSDNEWGEKHLSNIVNKNFREVGDAQTAIMRYLQGEQSFLQNRKRLKSKLKYFLSTESGTTSAHQIAESLTKLAGAAGNTGGASGTVDWGTTRTHLSERRLGKVGFSAVDIDQALASVTSLTTPSPTIRQLGPCIFQLSKAVSSQETVLDNA